MAISPRVGLVGCGRWGRLILRDLMLLGATVEVADPDADAREAALAAGAVAAHPDAGGFSPSPDGYVVASPATTHAEVTAPLLGAGKPIVVEKPLTADPDSARRLAAEGEGRLFMMDKWRRHPGVEALAEIGRSGRLGEVLAIRSYRVGWGRSQADVDAWWTLLPHDLSIARHILGHLPEARRVSFPVPGRKDSDFQVELGGEAGPTVTTEVSTSQPVSHRSVILIAEGGSAQLPFAEAGHVLVSRAGRREPKRFDIPNRQPLKADLRAFLRFLDGGPPPLTSGADGAEAVERIATLRTMAGLD